MKRTTGMVLLAATLAASQILAATSGQQVWVNRSWVDGEYMTSGIYVRMSGSAATPESYAPVANGDVFEAIVPEGHEITMWSWGLTSGGVTAFNVGHFSETNIPSAGDIKFTWNGTPQTGSTFPDMNLAVHLDWLKYGISFDANGGGGTMAPIGDKAYNANVTLPANAYAKSGFRFDGWSLSQDGPMVCGDGGSVSGATFGLSYTNKAAKLYARWAENLYTVRFHANFGADETADREFSCANAAAFPSNAFVRAGYVFAGWSTSSAQNASVEYEDGAIVAPLLDEPGTVNLFAVWTPNTYTVLFEGGADALGSMEPQDFTYGVAQQLALNGFTNGDLDFLGWSDGKGHEYADGVTVSNLTAEAGGEVTLTARWNAKFYVEFDGNGATSGEMQNQAIVRNVPTELAPNAFERTGYTFRGWSETVVGLVKYNDGASVTNLAQTGETKTLYAVWKANNYTVLFHGNGGLGQLDVYTNEQAFAYGEVKELDHCTFFRDNTCEFVGWATDPTGPVIYADGALVSNLCAIAGGVVKLFAKWQGIAETSPTEFEVAADCSTTTENGIRLSITTNLVDGVDYAVGSGADKGGNDQFILMQPSNEMGPKRYVVETVLSGSGSLSFWYKMENENGSNFQVSIEESDDNNVGHTVSAKLVPMDTEDHPDWVQFTTNFTTTTRKKISWAFSYIFPENVWAAIDCIRWVPDVVEGYAGITYRLNDGTAAPDDIWANETKKSGEAFAALPAEPSRLGYLFDGWYTERAGGEKVTEESVVGLDQTLYAHWLADEEHQLAVPVAIEGLVYDGAAKTGVVEAAGYTLEGNVATNAGDYAATATLADGYCWQGGSAGATQIVWSISKAVYDMSAVTFSNATFVADGTAKSLAVSGELPEGVTVSYEGNGKTEPGEYTVAAKFAGDTANHEPIADMTATLTITEADVPPVPVEIAVPTAVEGLVYDGTPKTGVAEGEGYTLSGNVATAVGDHVATATLLDGYCWTGGATGAVQIVWSIAAAPGPGPSAPELYPEGSELTAFAGNATYIGWLTRGDAVAGLVTVKAGKPNAKTGLSAVTVTATPAGAKKWTAKLAVEAGAMRDVRMDSAELSFSGQYVEGEISVNGTVYGVVAGVDYFKSKDKAEKAAAKEKVPHGSYTFGFVSPDGSFTSASATVAKSTGKTKTIVYLADGTKVSVSSQGVYGDGMSRMAVPVSYSKKGVTIGFVFWVGGAGGAELSGFGGDGVEVVAPQKVKALYGKYAFAADPFPAPYIDARSPAGTVFEAAGTKWTVPKTDQALKLKCAKTGVVTGSFKMFYPNGAKEKADTAKIVGVTIGDSVYGTAFIKKKGVNIAVGAAAQ